MILEPATKKVMDSGSEQIAVKMYGFVFGSHACFNNCMYCVDYIHWIIIIKWLLKKIYIKKCSTFDNKQVACSHLNCHLF